MEDCPRPIPIGRFANWTYPHFGFSPDPLMVASKAFKGFLWVHAVPQSFVAIAKQDSAKCIAAFAVLNPLSALEPGIELETAQD